MILLATRAAGFVRMNARRFSVEVYGEYDSSLAFRGRVRRGLGTHHGR